MTCNVNAVMRLSSSLIQFSRPLVMQTLCTGKAHMKPASEIGVTDMALDTCIGSWTNKMSYLFFETQPDAQTCIL